MRSLHANVPVSLPRRAVVSLALGLSLLASGGACKRDDSSNAPKSVRTAIEAGLMKDGYNVPRVFADALTPGTVIDATDESVICPSEQLLEAGQVQPGDASGLGLTERPLKLGSTLLKRLEQAGGGAGIEGVDIDVSAASLSGIDGFGEPSDAGCAAAVAKRQNEGKQVMVVTQSLAVDAAFTLHGTGDAGKIGEALGVSLAGGSGSGAGLIVAYKAEEMPLPGACEAVAPCTRARRVDGACRCVSCELTVDAWATKSGHQGRARGGSVVLEKDAGFSLTCPNMPAGALDIRGQGMMTTGIIDESAGKIVQAWSGCLELRGGDATLGDACIEQPEAGREGYINVVPKDAPSRDAAGDVAVEIRNRGTKLGDKDGGPAVLQQAFSLQVRAPEHAR